MHPLKFAVVLFTASVLYILTTSIVTWSYGIVRPSNPSLPMVIFFLGGTIVCLGSIALLVLATRAAFRRATQSAAVLTLAALIGLASPFIVRHILPIATQQGELRDLQSVGLSQLRDDVAALITSSKHSYLGRSSRDVPAADLPKSLQRLASRVGSVQVWDGAVSIKTDGLGSWRGGYIITPSGSSFVPERSRQITDGVFYATGN